MKISTINTAIYEPVALRTPIQRTSSPETRPSSQTVDEFIAAEEAFREAKEEQKDELLADTFDFSVTDFIDWIVEKLDLSDHLGFKRKKKRQNDKDTEEEQEMESLSLVG